MSRIVAAAALAFVVGTFTASAARAQVFVTPPVVSYYSAPVVTYAPPVVSYYAPPAVSYYAPPVVTYAPPVVEAAPARVSYYAAPATSVGFFATPAYPVSVTRGLFGRTTVRTPFYKVKYFD